MTSDLEGLYVVDVSNPSQCRTVGHYRNCKHGYGVLIATNCIYVADGENGLLALCTLPNLQSTLRIHDGNPGSSCLIEASPILGPAAQWLPIYTNASPTFPFEFTDYDVRASQYPQKFYRARQP